MSALLDDRARAVIRAKDMFVDGTLTTTQCVGPEVAASWLRSIKYGLRPAACTPKWPHATHTYTQLRRAAVLVMEGKRTALAHSTMVISLTAADGTTLERWVEDAELLRRLDRMNAVCGTSIAESVMGTSSSTIALETERPFGVAGPEHFSESWLEYTSSSALIRHPLTKQIIATVNLSVSYAHTSPALLSWVIDIAAEIEGAILGAASSREHLLLQAFLSSHRDSRHPVICLDDRTIISNAAAARVLGPSDQALLWEHASRCLHEGVRTSQVTLGDGRTAALDLTTVFDGEKAFGRVIRLQPTLDGHALTPKPADVENPALPPLVGRSAAWQKLCRDVHASHGISRLFVGGAGVGKMAVCRASGAQDAAVFDAAEFQGRTRWARALAEAGQGDHHHIVLRHLDLLGGQDLAATFAFVAQATGRGIRVDATASTQRGSDTTALLSEWFDTVVVVPDLAERIDDLPLLLEWLGQRTVQAGKGRSLRWLPDAVQTLSRIEWTRNVRSLESLVARLAAESRFPSIGSADLPSDVRARAVRRGLVGLERVEASAIVAALRDANGNKREAAATLGIARSTLYRKVRALGIDLASWNF
jgi:transcriptional regulator of acetoin/glycerol metabolism